MLHLSTQHLTSSCSSAASPALPSRFPTSPFLPASHLFLLLSRLPLLSTKHPREDPSQLACERVKIRVSKMEHSLVQPSFPCWSKTSATVGCVEQGCPSLKNRERDMHTKSGNPSSAVDNWFDLACGSSWYEVDDPQGAGNQGTLKLRSTEADHACVPMRAFHESFRCSVLHTQNYQAMLCNILFALCCACPYSMDTASSLPCNCPISTLHTSLSHPGRSCLPQPRPSAIP
eukprot:1138339-Pelagomonas_calceolata.AAC.2